MQNKKTFDSSGYTLTYAKGNYDNTFLSFEAISYPWTSQINAFVKSNLQLANVCMLEKCCWIERIEREAN